MLPEEARAAMLYIAWDLSHKAEQQSGAEMRARTAKAWKAREEAEKEAEAARCRQKVAQGPDITPEELKALEEEVKFAEEEEALAILARNAARKSARESREKLRESKQFVAARKELAAQGKPE